MRTMQALREAAVALGFLGLVLTTYLRFGLGRFKNLDWLVGCGISLVLIALGVYPDLFDSVLSFFTFERGGGERLIGLLIFSNLLLYVLYSMAIARTSQVEQLTDRLVRELAKREFRLKDGRDDARIYVIIPAYNEAENIGGVLQRIPAEIAGLRTKLIVVIDGATDDTARVVDELNHKAISYTVNRGGGSALRAGYEVALEDGAEIIVTLDADGQHMPEEIPSLVAPILSGDADLVNGSRVLGEYEKDSTVRASGLVLFNWLISVLAMRRITDCSNAFRAIRASELGKLTLRQSQFHTSELLLEALKKGLRVVEVPIKIKRRQSGLTKKPAALKYGWGFAKAIVTTWLR
jgi:cellulose synthase/poly-beta-1,6-N-acetylglucosamine synthase-like glycosyltransferase